MPAVVVANNIGMFLQYGNVLTLLSFLNVLDSGIAVVSRAPDRPWIKFYPCMVWRPAVGVGLVGDRDRGEGMGWKWCS